MPRQEPDPDLVFSINMGMGYERNVYVVGEPETYTVMISDPNRDAMISINRVDWERIVERVKEQF